MKYFVTFAFGLFFLTQAKSQTAVADSSYVDLNNKLLSVMMPNLPDHRDPVIAFSVRISFDGSNNPTITFSKSTSNKYRDSFNKLAKEFTEYCRGILVKKSMKSGTFQIPIFYAGEFYANYDGKLYSPVKNMFSFESETDIDFLYLTRLFGHRQHGRIGM